MKDTFKIYIEQLRDGRTEAIEEHYAPDFIDLKDDEAVFKRDVQVEGQAYLADGNLIIHLQVIAYVIVPCSICNRPVEVEISIPDFYHMEPAEEIKTGIFDFSEMLREAIVLEIPPFGECNSGNCPERAAIAKFLNVKSEKASSDIDGDEGYQPFADINFDKYKPTT